MPECWWNKNTKIKSNLLTRFQLPLGTYPQTVRVPSLFLKYNIHARNTPKSYSVQLSLQHIKSILTPGPLYLLFPLPRMPLPQIFISSLSSDITSSKCRATRFKKKKKPAPKAFKVPTPCFIYHISLSNRVFFLSFCLHVYYLSPPTDCKLHNSGDRLGLFSSPSPKRPVPGTQTTPRE